MKQITIKQEIINDIKKIKKPILVKDKIYYEKDTHTIFINSDGDYMSLNLIYKIDNENITMSLHSHSRREYTLDMIKEKLIEQLEYVNFDKMYDGK